MATIEHHGVTMIVMGLYIRHMQMIGAMMAVNYELSAPGANIESSIIGGNYKAYEWNFYGCALSGWWNLCHANGQEL
jgi:hypothetical protein